MEFVVHLIRQVVLGRPTKPPSYVHIFELTNFLHREHSLEFFKLCQPVRKMQLKTFADAALEELAAGTSNMDCRLATWLAFLKALCLNKTLTSDDVLQVAWCLRQNDVFWNHLSIKFDRPQQQQHRNNNNNNNKTLLIIFLAGTAFAAVAATAVCRFHK